MGPNKPGWFNSPSISGYCLTSETTSVKLLERASFICHSEMIHRTPEITPEITVITEPRGKHEDLFNSFVSVYEDLFPDPLARPDRPSPQMPSFMERPT